MLIQTSMDKLGSEQIYANHYILNVIAVCFHAADIPPMIISLG